MFEPDAPWPPKPVAALMPKLAEWSAWYDGSVEALTGVYQRSSGPRVRPSQYAGGLVGTLSRFFWGQPQSANGQARHRLHMPIASDIATASSDLLFGEEVGLDADGANLTRLGAILDGNSWQSLLPEAAELSAALGGVYLRAGWDADVAGHPLATVMHADGAIPTFVYGRLRKVTFWQVVRQDGSTIWRHLEHHEPGRIVHELRQGDASRLGHPVPLAESDQTAGIPVDADSAILTGIPKLTVSYIPNVRPNRRWRNDPVGRNLGRADIDGTEPFMDALDEAWTSWMRDIRLGKSRIMVPQEFLNTTGPGQAAFFDADRDVYVAMKAMGDPNAALSQQISAQQFAIRVTEHAQTVRGLLGTIVQSSGYSAMTFGLNEEATATATEVSARERRTMGTREKKSRYWTAGLEDFLETLTLIDREVFRQGEVLSPKIIFPAAATPSPREVAESVQLLHAAQAVSVETRVRMTHPDWDDQQVSLEVEAIKAEQNLGPIGPVDITLDPATLA